MTPHWQRLRLRLRSLFHRDTLDDSLSGELAFHFEQQVAELVAEGMRPHEAELEARRRFGPISSIREQCRDMRRTQLLEDLYLDCLYTLRSLRQSPVFASVAILTLALGIGANTAFFAIAHGILIQPLPYPEPDRLITVEQGIYGLGPVTTLRGFSRTTNYAGYHPNHDLNLQIGSEARKLRAATATSNLAEVLRVRPAIGRWFARDEETPGRSRLAVLSHETWRNQFASDSSIIGRKIILNERPFEVIGVMPAGFAFPTPQTELWIPVTLDPRAAGDMWGGGNLIALGRLNPGVAIATAQAELLPIVERICPLFPWPMPDAWGKSSVAVSYQESLSRSVGVKFMVLAAASLLLLLIACGNVANLLLARGIAREREFNLRQALGANPARLLRQWLTENFVLLSLGSIAGLGISVLIFEVLPAILPKGTPRLHEVVLRLRPLLVGVSISCLVTAFLFSLAPLFHYSRLRAGALAGRSITTSRGSTRFSLALIAVELCLATTLLIGAGLMGRTLWQLAQADSGIRASQTVTARLSAGPSRCPNAARCKAFIESISSELLSQPGVRGVNWANSAQLDRDLFAVSVAIEDHPREPREPAFVLWQSNVTPGFFRSLGVPLHHGQTFSGARHSILISESTARRFWPGRSPIGKHVRPMSDKQWFTVIGVVADVELYSLYGFPSFVDGVFYRPLDETIPDSPAGRQLSVFIESASAAPITSLRAKFNDLVITRIQTLGDIRKESVSDQRSTALLLSCFASIGLLLGIAGVYGVISHRTAQRTREIGIRIALGATRRQILRMVMSETVAVALLGAGAGILAAYVLSAYLKTMVFGITIHDPLSFAISPLALLLAAIVTAALPALRSSRTDPATTLRAD